MANRPSRSTGVTPFYLAHGYDLEPIQLSEPVAIRPSSRSPVAAGEAIATKLIDTQNFATTMLANAKAEYERYDNKHRTASPAYKPGDAVWLDLRNFRSMRPSKKLDSLKG